MRHGAPHRGLTGSPGAPSQAPAQGSPQHRPKVRPAVASSSLTLMLLKREPGQRPAWRKEASLPWRTPGSDQSPMVAAAAGRDGGRARAGGGTSRGPARRAGAAARVAAESGGGGRRRLAARRLPERVRAQKFYKWPLPSPMMKRALPPPSFPRLRTPRAPAPSPAADAPSDRCDAAADRA